VSSESVDGEEEEAFPCSTASAAKSFSWLEFATSSSSASSRLATRLPLSDVASSLYAPRTVQE